MRRLAAAFALAAALAAAPAHAAARDTLTVVTLNLWHDQHDWPKRLARIVRELRALAPDVVCLQEVLQHESLPNQAATLAESLGYHAHFVSVDSVTRVKRYGNAILARVPFARADGRFLAPLDDYRVVAHVRLDWRGVPLDVYDTHLHHTAEGAHIRRTQVMDLLPFVAATRGDGAVVLAGDFNCAPGTPELAPVERAFVNAYSKLHPGARGLDHATMNPRFDPNPRRIDHVFVPRRANVRLVPVESRILFRDVGPDSVWATDHFGVLARFEVRGR